MVPTEEALELTGPDFVMVPEPPPGSREIKVIMPVELGQKFLSPILAVDADGKNGKMLVDATAFTVPVDVALPEDRVSYPVELMRRIQILGRLPGDPQHLLVEALGAPPPRAKKQLGSDAPPPFPRLGPLPNSVFKLNVNTGRLTPLTEETRLGKFLHDWQGQARIAYEQPEYALARTFMHQRPGRSGWRRPADSTAGSLPQTFTLSPANYFGERAIPLGFDFDPKVLYYASNVGRDTFGVYGWNVETRQRTPLAVEHPHFDLVPLEPEFPSPALVFDEHRRRLVGVRTTGVTPLTAWLDPQLAKMQDALDEKFPGQTVELLEWDDARENFLLCITSGSEPGRFQIYQGRKNKFLGFLIRAPWLDPATLHVSMPFEFDTAAGVHLSGYLTFPRAPRLNPPPLVVYLPAGFPARAQPEFDREAQVLAGMGMMVMRLNHRGAMGFGAKHRDAIQAGVDRVPVEDIRAAIEWAAGRYPVDRRRIATMGEGFGGYLALRALQLAPDTFRCGIAIDAPLDLELWLRPEVEHIEADRKVDFAQEVRRAYFRRNAQQLADTSVLRKPETLTKPVFLIVNPGARSGVGAENSRLRSRLKQLERVAEYLELESNDFALGLPAARARVFRQIEEFFNLNLYDYKVQIGEAKEKK
jgi:dienelactone hydrolase